MIARAVLRTTHTSAVEAIVWTCSARPVAKLGVVTIAVLGTTLESGTAPDVSRAYPVVARLCRIAIVDAWAAFE